MKVKVIRPFVDKNTGETMFIKQTFTATKERAKELIEKGFVEEVKEKKK